MNLQIALTLPSFHMKEPINYLCEEFVQHLTTTSVVPASLNLTRIHHRPPSLVPQVRESLLAKEEMEDTRGLVEGCNWMPEYGSWMVGAPQTTLGSSISIIVSAAVWMARWRARLDLPTQGTATT